MPLYIAACPHNLCRQQSHDTACYSGTSLFISQIDNLGPIDRCQSTRETVFSLLYVLYEAVSMADRLYVTNMASLSSINLFFSFVVVIFPPQ
jgi:hypothetical protein